MSHQSLTVLIFLANLLGLGLSGKLNEVRVLLPYNTGIPTNYTLEISEGGCYKWTSSRPDVVPVTPLDEDIHRLCSTQALVSAIYPLPGHHTAVIFAEDETTGQVLRCDVIVDAIRSIEILTTTRELFLEDVPVVFEVWAKNDQKDTFTSLEGVPFDWQIHAPQAVHSDGSESNEVLRFLKFSESSYETPAAVDYWEQRGYHGYKVLMEGLRTGSARVSVVPRDLTYKNVAPAEIGLVILANLVLYPARDLHVLLYTSVKYRVELIKQRRRYVIPMPSSQYYLELNDTRVGSLDPSSSTFYSHQYGHALVTLKDRNMDSGEVPKEPSSLIHVVTPMFMNFKVQPGSKWSLLEASTYLVTLELFDSSHFPIFLADNLRVEVKFPAKYFRVISSTDNGTHHQVATLLPGSCSLVATFLGVLQEDEELLKFDPAVTTTQEVVIYQKVAITPPYVLLPWDPVAQPTYTVTLQATGGTSFFRWHLNDSAVASVSYKPSEPSTNTKLTIGKLGTVAVRCIDAHNSLFTASSLVSLQPIGRIDILPSQLETTVNSSLTIPVALYGKDEEGRWQMFQDCSQVTLDQWLTGVAELVTDPRDSPTVPSPGAGCRSLTLRCLSPGHAQLYVSVPSAGLNVSTTIGCYLPLQLVHPVKGAAILAVGSSIDVAYLNGPQPWPAYPQGHHLTTKTSGTNSIVKSHHVEDRDELRVFRVVCETLGTSDFTLVVENLPSDSNPYPASSKSTVKIECLEPHSLHLRPQVSIVTPRCILSESKAKVLSSQEFQALVWAEDSRGRKFYNISSLELHWTLEGSHLGRLELDLGSEIKLESVAMGAYYILHHMYNTFLPAGTAGLVRITVDVSRYYTDALIEEQIVYPPHLNRPLQTSLAIDLVEPASLKPSTLRVFYHPKHKGILQVVHGSGQFTVEPSSNAKSGVRLLASEAQIEIAPSTPEVFTVSVSDLCLPSLRPATAVIRVYVLTKLRVHLPRQLEVGQTAAAYVEPLDDAGDMVPPHLFSLLDLQSAISDPAVLSISPNSSSSSSPHPGAAVFAVQALELGTATVTFKAYNDVTSQAGTIQVFGPLQISPTNLTLVVGAAFQVEWRGGPQLLQELMFTTEPGVARVNQAGLITATALGSTRVQARSEGLTPVEVNVHVVALAGVRIVAPLTSLRPGAEMVVYVAGLNPQEGPYAFGSAVPHLSIQWSYSGQNVVELSSVLQENGLEAGEENWVAMRVRALHPGLATLQVRVAPSEPATAPHLQQLVGNNVYTDELQIKVVEGLRLVSPPSSLESQTLLMAPHSEMRLRTNHPARVTLLAGSGVAVDRERLVRAGGQPGLQAALKVSAQQSDHHLFLHTEVQPVSYLGVSGAGDKQFDSAGRPYVYLPMGASVLLRLAFHDDSGRRFHAYDGHHIKYRPSRFDLVRISQGQQNHTLHIQALNEGFTVLKVWDSASPQLVPAYLTLQVGSGIHPHSVELHVGQVVCFSSSLRSVQGSQAGQWSVSQGSVVVHPTSGTAVAMEPGTAQLHYTLPSFTTSTLVTVLPIRHLSLDPNYLSSLSDILPQGRHYLVPVYLGDHHTSHEGNCSLTDTQLPVRCQVSLQNSKQGLSAMDLFDVGTIYHSEQGRYLCKLTPLRKLPTQESSQTEAELWLRATSGDLTSDPLPLNLLPHFYVFQEELSLSGGWAVLAVSALPAVQRCIMVNVVGPLQVKGPETDPAQPGLVIYHVGLAAGTEVESPAVVLSCGMTGQTTTVPVLGVVPDSECSSILRFPASSYPASQLLQWIAVATAITSALFIGYLGYRYLLSGPQPGQPRVFFMDKSMDSSYPRVPTTPPSPRSLSHLWTAADH